MCMSTLKVIKEQKKHYEDILKNCKNNLQKESIQEIERQFKTSLAISIPNIRLNEIEKFYTLIS